MYDFHYQITRSKYPKLEYVKSLLTNSRHQQNKSHFISEFHFSFKGCGDLVTFSSVINVDVTFVAPILVTVNIILRSPSMPMEPWNTNQSEFIHVVEKMYYNLIQLE